MLTEMNAICAEPRLHGNLEPDTLSFLKEMMGISKHMAALFEQVKLVAPTGLTVLICGETGTGKEVIANALRHAPAYETGPFVPLDCGAISPSLFESELFGHEKGSFTGADRMKFGKFEVAAGGTLFLDEISNLPLHVQPKLLRALQERQIFRVGGTHPIAVNPRLLVASNDDLLGLVQAKKFRRDLYHRLNEFCIKIPPLRERKEDIEYLAERFLAIANEELKKSVKLSWSALQLLLSYSWPGNVRELRNAIRRATLQAETEICPEHLYLSDVRSGASLQQLDVVAQFDGSLSLKEIVHDAVVKAERRVLVQVLNQTRGNKAKAARLLKVDYKTVHGKIKSYGIIFAGGTGQEYFKG